MRRVDARLLERAPIRIADAHAALAERFAPCVRRQPAHLLDQSPCGARPAAARAPDEISRSLNWARRLKRVFGIEIEQCVRCGGRLQVIASIEEPELIVRILAHRERYAEDAHPAPSPRAPSLL